MGTECTKLSSKPGVSTLSTRLQSQESDFIRCTEMLYFEIRLENLKLSNSVDVVQKITFSIEGLFEVSFPKSEYQLNEKTTLWHTTRVGNFQIMGEELDRKKMRIYIYDRKGRVIQKLSFKLLQICTGPSRQDHLLKQLKTRLTFDIRITQRMTLGLILENCRLSFEGESPQDISKFSYSLSLKGNEDDQIYQTQRAFFDPNFKMNLSLSDIEILSHKLKQSAIRIQIWKKVEESESQEEQPVQCYSDVYVPYMRLMTDFFTSATENGKEIQRRKIDFEEVLNEHDRIKCQFSLTAFTSKLYLEQMECLVFSENGIGTVSPNCLNGETKADVQISQLKEELQILKKLENFSSREKGTIKKALLRVYDMTKSSKMLFTSNEELYEIQAVLLQILEKSARMLRAGQEILNQNLWRVIDAIIHRKQLSIRYFMLHYAEKLKKEVTSKLYCFICLLLQKIIHSTTIGVTYHQLKCIQKFTAYAFFRFPWLQKSIMCNLTQETDPIITPQKLIQFGACKSVKTPSKSVVFDWEGSIFNEVKNNQEFKKALTSLQELSCEVPHWAKNLFNRGDDELFYGLLIEIWNEAELSLNQQGQIRWEYFPCYGELLSAFFGQMNQKPIASCSPKFQQCSLKLIENQKLMNTFMSQLFSKTCVYESQSVLKCLDLIKGYFQVLSSKNKRLPVVFNFKYFYTAIKLILDSNHSYLLIKTISLIYDYYHLFSKQLQGTLNSHILGKPFFSLFLHWSEHVRKTFFYLLKHRIAVSFQSSIQDSQNTFINTDREPHTDRQLYYKYRDLLHALEQLEVETQCKKKHQAILQSLPYYVFMQQKLKSKKESRRVPQKRRKMAQSLHLETKGNQYSQSKDMKSSKMRRWSATVFEVSIVSIPEGLSQYIIGSMKEFREVSDQQDPNTKTINIEKIFKNENALIDS